jgi:SUMO ligase MMS21 Smc5/6 complex component
MVWVAVGASQAFFSPRLIQIVVQGWFVVCCPRGRCSHGALCTRQRTKKRDYAPDTIIERRDQVEQQRGEATPG